MERLAKVLLAPDASRLLMAPAWLVSYLLGMYTVLYILDLFELPTTY